MTGGQTMTKFQLITKGLIKENPTFVLLLGMCPTLATTTSAINGMSMGLATMFVLVLSNMAISAVANVIPDKVRIPAYIVIIATFVTLLQFVMQAYTPAIYETLGTGDRSRFHAFPDCPRCYPGDSRQRLRIRVQVPARRRHSLLCACSGSIHGAWISHSAFPQVD